MDNMDAKRSSSAAEVTAPDVLWSSEPFDESKYDVVMVLEFSMFWPIHVIDTIRDLDVVLSGTSSISSRSHFFIP